MKNKVKPVSVTKHYRRENSSMEEVEKGISQNKFHFFCSITFGLILYIRRRFCLYALFVSLVAGFSYRCCDWISYCCH